MVTKRTRKGCNSNTDNPLWGQQIISFWWTWSRKFLKNKTVLTADLEMSWDRSWRGHNASSSSKRAKAGSGHRGSGRWAGRGEIERQTIVKSDKHKGTRAGLHDFPAVQSPGSSFSSGAAAVSALGLFFPGKWVYISCIQGKLTEKALLFSILLLLKLKQKEKVKIIPEKMDCIT